MFINPLPNNSKIFVYFFRSMSCISSVARANDELMLAAHEVFETWKAVQRTRGKQKVKSNFQWALQHYDSCRRAISRACETFTNRKSYACGIATTYVVGREVFWRSRQSAEWKRAGREPPPCPRNGGPTRVFYNHNRDEIYR